MKTLFNHLFYRVYWWNRNVLKEKDSLLYSTIIGISVFHALNYCTIIFAFFLYVIKDPLAYPKWAHIIMIVLIPLINYTIYWPKGYYKFVISEASNQPKDTLIKRDYILIAYIIITISSFIYMIVEGREFLGVTN